MGYSPWGRKESDTAEQLSMIQHTHTFCYSSITLHVNKGKGSRSLEQEVAILDWRNQGRLPGGRHGNPFQYFCLENTMDRGVWWAIVHGHEELDTTQQLTLCCFGSMTEIKNI